MADEMVPLENPHRALIVKAEDSEVRRDAAYGRSQDEPTEYVTLGDADPRTGHVERCAESCENTNNRNNSNNSARARESGSSSPSARSGPSSERPADGQDGQNERRDPVPHNEPPSDSEMVPEPMPAHQIVPEVHEMQPLQEVHHQVHQVHQLYPMHHHPIRHHLHGVAMHEAMHDAVHDAVHEDQVIHHGATYTLEPCVTYTGEILTSCFAEKRKFVELIKVLID